MDNELKNEWGSWLQKNGLEKIESGIDALGNVSAPAALKHRLLRQNFNAVRSTRRMSFCYAGIALCTAGCAALVLVNSGTSSMTKPPITLPTEISQNHAAREEAAAQVSIVSDEDVGLLADALDDDSVASQLAFDLVSNSDVSTQEELL